MDSTLDRITTPLAFLAERKVQIFCPLYINTFPFLYLFCETNKQRLLECPSAHLFDWNIVNTDLPAKLAIAQDVGPIVIYLTKKQVAHLRSSVEDVYRRPDLTLLSHWHSNRFKPAPQDIPVSRYRVGYFFIQWPSEPAHTVTSIHALREYVENNPKRGPIIIRSDSKSLLRVFRHNFVSNFLLGKVPPELRPDILEELDTIYLTDNYTPIFRLLIASAHGLRAIHQTSRSLARIDLQNDDAIFEDCDELTLCAFILFQKETDAVFEREICRAVEEFHKALFQASDSLLTDIYRGAWAAFMEITTLRLPIYSLFESARDFVECIKLHHNEL